MNTEYIGADTRDRYRSGAADNAKIRDANRRWSLIRRTRRDLASREQRPRRREDGNDNTFSLSRDNSPRFLSSLSRRER